MNEPSHAAAARRLSAELEAAAARQLLAEWHTINWSSFREALRPPTIALSESSTRLGLWVPTHRRIEIARDLLLSHPWSVVVEVLKHEMAHQYAHEVLRATDETSHGPAFQRVCAAMGIDPSSEGLPRPRGASLENEGERVLERVSKLLALAESSNEHEAQAAMSAAQKLMLKYNLAARSARPDYSHRHLGPPLPRTSEAESILASILAEHFFVDTIWISTYVPETAKKATILEICGSHANLEMATYVHTFLRETSQRLWTGHKRARSIKGDKDRRKFIAGVMLGFRDKLRAQTELQRQEGLVWVKDGDLDDFFRSRHPRVRTVRYGGGAPSAAYEHGREAGKQIVLHRPVGSGPSHQTPLLSSGRLKGGLCGLC